MLLTAEPPPSMDKSSSIHPSHLPRSRTTPRKERERGATALPGSHRQKSSKPGRLPAKKERPQKEKPETKEVKSDQETEVKLKTTVVDIDSVRDDEVKEENLGLLEAAEQEDGESKPKEKSGAVNCNEDVIQWLCFFKVCMFLPVLKMKKIILWFEMFEGFFFKFFSVTFRIFFFDRFRNVMIQINLIL